MEQVKIVRKTRQIFESTGVIPDPNLIDPSLKPGGISAVDLANMMLVTPWKELPKEFQRLRGFFTENSSRLFRDTMLTENLVYVCFPQIDYFIYLNESFVDQLLRETP
jgi:hypothetical protein